jgi:hypothetical protein
VLIINLVFVLCLNLLNIITRLYLSDAGVAWLFVSEHVTGEEFAAVL